MTSKIKIYCKKKITKKQFRYHKKKYKTNICKIITQKPYKNKDNFIKLINSYTIKNLKKTKFIIYPYCSEKINFSVYLDKENMFKIDKTLLNLIEKDYNCEFNKDKNLIKEIGKNYVAQKNNPCKFIEYLFKHLNNKNHFIITHSNFLKKLSIYIRNNKCSIFNNKLNNKLNNKKTKKKTDEDTYDNLDILQLVIDISDKDNYKLKYGIIRRFDEKYRLYSSFNIGNDKKNCNKNTKSVFLMRHCVACHNISNIFLRQIKLGYGTYSSCMEDTNTEINKISKYLKTIIKDYGGIKTFQFGSSIVFRAILTLLIVYNSLIKNPKSNKLK